MLTFLIFLLTIVAQGINNSQFYGLDIWNITYKSEFTASSFTCAALCQNNNCAAFKFRGNMCRLTDDYDSFDNSSTTTESYFATMPKEVTEEYTNFTYCPFNNYTTPLTNRTSCSKLSCKTQTAYKAKDTINKKNVPDLCGCLDLCKSTLNCIIFGNTKKEPCYFTTNSISGKFVPLPKKDTVFKVCTCSP